jgi:site-specific DNA-cytosine methylase
MGIADSFQWNHGTGTGRRGDEAGSATATTEHRRGQWYRQVGNAVCPPVVEAVAAQILIALDAAAAGTGGPGNTPV